MTLMYKSTLCHLHSLFEGPASISGFCYEAARAGVDIVWLSDHDTRIPGVNRYEHKFTGYQFGTADPFAAADVYWEQVEVTCTEADFLTSHAPRTSLICRVTNDGDEWGGASLRLKAKGNYNRRPLISRPELILDLTTNIDPQSPDTRLMITIHLTQTPPEHQPISFSYIWGAPPKEHDLLWLPLPAPAGENIRLPLAAAAAQLGIGREHTVLTFDIRLESRKGRAAEAVLTEIALETGIVDPYLLLQTQQEIGKEIGRRYGVDVLAGYEISGGPMHLTCFGADIPFFPYVAGKKPATEEIIAHVSDHGGIVSINHPFSPWKRMELTDRERWELVETRAAEFIERQAYGARLIEIGYPEGRHGFTPEHYLKLWDLLNLAGLRIYGIGVSDAHSNVTWEKGNNYANYIASPDCEAEHLVAAMKTGRCYMADPWRVHGRLQLQTDQGKTMGEQQKGGFVSLVIDGVPPGAELIWVRDGEEAGSDREEGGRIESRCPLDRGERFVRAQVRDADGRLILLTNPVWLG
ncbi:MAG TPA: CehA/McbA family metallohydrolase [Firmicutes bacterium]|nr:CehA/McbA family metallohydrolase [Bacillota bacterium]